jgi:hypothetical protein
MLRYTKINNILYLGFNIIKSNTLTLMNIKIKQFFKNIKDILVISLE